MEEKELTKDIIIDKKIEEHNDDSSYPFNDVKYICESTSLIVDSIQKGFDVTQLPSGDITVSEIRVVNVHYGWNKDKQKFVKIGQN